MMRVSVPICLALILCLGCASQGRRSTRVDPDEDDRLGGTGLDSADARTIADRMARSMIDRTAGYVPNGATVAVIPAANHTRFFVDADFIAGKIESSLMNRMAPGRYTFLARSHIDAILKEREGKRNGVFDAPGELGKLLGANYLLAVKIEGISKASSGDRSDYLQTTVTLINAETSAKIWNDYHEFKKVGTAGTIYR